MCQTVCFLSRFGLKTDIDFDHYGLQSGMVFKGTTRAYTHMENGMFRSEIRSGFKEPCSTEVTPRVQSCPFLISRLIRGTHARINEIKTNETPDL